MFATRSIARRLGAASIAALVRATVVVAAAEHAPQATGSADVAAIVRQSLAAERDYQAGDLITRRQAEAALKRVEQAAGRDMPAAARDALLKRTLADDAPLVKQLRSPAGKKFMRHVATMPQGYDVLDRMWQMPQGRDAVTRLVKGPDGHKLLAYMTESKGGAELERMLSKTPTGGDFRKPTGKIYTAEQLAEELQKAQPGSAAPPTAAGKKRR